MREEEAEFDAEAEVIDPVLGSVLARRMGRLAEYATQIAKGVVVEPIPVVAARLESARDELSDILAALGISGEGDSEPPSPQAPRTIRPKTSKLLAESYPDTPFYNSILPTTEWRQGLEPWDSKHAIHFYIISDHYLYCAETGRVCELNGDVLFVFNALLKTLQSPQVAKVHKDFGYRPSNNETATAHRFRATLQSLASLLTSIAPNDFGDTVAEEGYRPVILRMLHPDIVVEDKRTDESYARFIPKRATKSESTEADGSPAADRLTISQIARAAKASRQTVRNALEEVLGDTYSTERDRGNGFDIETALRAVAAINSNKIVRQPDDLPHDRTRVSVLVAAARELGLNINTAAAINVLRVAGFEPEKVETKIAAPKGLVWSVREEGALAALFAAKGLELPEAAAATTPGAEAQPTKLLDTDNTVGSIEAFLNATRPEGQIEFNADDINRAINTVVAEVDQKLLRTGHFSHYAAKKIVAAAWRHRGITP